MSLHAAWHSHAALALVQLPANTHLFTQEKSTFIHFWCPFCVKNLPLSQLRTDIFVPRLQSSSMMLVRCSLQTKQTIVQVHIPVATWCPNSFDGFATVIEELQRFMIHCLEKANCDGLYNSYYVRTYMNRSIHTVRCWLYMYAECIVFLHKAWAFITVSGHDISPANRNMFLSESSMDWSTCVNEKMKRAEKS